MKQSADEPKSPIERHLDRAFFDLLSIARATSSADGWTTLISLMALKFLYDFKMPMSATLNPAAGQQAWAILGNSPTTVRIPEGIDRIATEVEEQIPALAGVFQGGPINGISRFPETALADCLFTLSQFSPSSMLSADPSAFGRWFDRQIDKSAMRANSAGPSVTPPSIAKLMVSLADVPSHSNVLDPCCGLGTLLSEAAKRIEDSRLFGQEINRESWAIAKLRLFLLGHDVDHIVLGDTLQRPAFVDGAKLQTFECVICDAPIGMTLPRGSMHDPVWERFAYGHPGRGAMDNAFVQHAVQSLKPGGTAVALVSHGLLFRAGTDARVRESLVEAGLVKSVIGLPAKLRPETAIETAVVVFEAGIKGKDILFIDVAPLQPQVRGRLDLSDELVEIILELSRFREPREGVAKLANLDEIRNNDFSLLPRRYVASVEKSEVRVDLNSIFAEAMKLEAEHDEAVTEMDLLIRELLDKR